MPIKVTDENGNEIEAFTKAELEAQRQQVEKEFEGKLADKDKHVSDKLNEFINARKGDLEKQDQISKDQAEKIATAEKMAQEAKQAALDAEARRLSAYKEFLVKQSLGEDPEMLKKFEDAYAFINMPATTDAELQARVQKTIEFGGFNAGGSRSVPMYGGYAPRVEATQQAAKDADYEKFKNILNLGDLVDPKKDDK